MVSAITDGVMEKLAQWWDRLPKALYTFVFADCQYVVLGYDVDREKAEWNEAEVLLDANP